MHLRMLARRGCSGGSCPAIFDLADLDRVRPPGEDDLAVQGKQPDALLLAALAELQPRAADENVTLTSRRLLREALYPAEPVEPAALMAQFETFAYSAWKVEQRQHYAQTGADLEWAELVRRNRRWGKTHQRVHFVTEPLTAAMQQELTEGYAPNVTAGEDVFIWAVPEGEWPDGMPRRDSLLFDSSRLYEMNYDPDGTFAGAIRITDPEQIVEACRVRDVALHHAVPWRAYIATRAELQHRLAQ